MDNSVTSSMHLTEVQQQQLVQLHELQTAMTKEGFVIVSSVALYTQCSDTNDVPPGVHFSTRLSVAEKNNVPIDHAVLDALREITALWSDGAH